MPEGIREVRARLLAGARERCARVARAAERLCALSGEAAIGVRADMRRDLSELARLAYRHGSVRPADLARRCWTDLVTAELLSGPVPASMLSTCRASVTALAEALRAPDPTASTGGGAGRVVVLAPPDHAVDPTCCDLETDPARVPDRVAGGPALALVLDLALPADRIEQVVTAVRKSAREWEARLPILAVGQLPSALARFRLAELGADSVLPAGSSWDDVAREADRVLRAPDAARGVVHLLGDRERVARRLREDLAPEGLRVEACPTLTDVARAWLARAPDAVVVDGGDGRLEAALSDVVELRRDMAARGTPIVVVLDQPDPGSRRALIAAGADGWMLVPYTARELRSALIEPLWLRAVAGADGDEQAATTRPAVPGALPRTAAGGTPRPVKMTPVTAPHAQPIEPAPQAPVRSREGTARTSESGEAPACQGARRAHPSSSVTDEQRGQAGRIAARDVQVVSERRPGPRKPVRSHKPVQPPEPTSPLEPEPPAMKPDRTPALIATIQPSEEPVRVGRALVLPVGRPGPDPDPAPVPRPESGTVPPPAPQFEGRARPAAPVVPAPSPAAVSRRGAPKRTAALRDTDVQDRDGRSEADEAAWRSLWRKADPKPRDDEKLP